MSIWKRLFDTTDKQIQTTIERLLADQPGDFSQASKDFIRVAKALLDSHPDLSDDEAIRRLCEATEAR